jgi:hypothetical protein
VAGLAFTLLLGAGACGLEMEEGFAPDEEVEELGEELVQEAVDGVESAADLEAVDGERAEEVVDTDPGRVPIDGIPGNLTSGPRQRGVRRSSSPPIDPASTSHGGAMRSGTTTLSGATAVPNK